MNRCQLQYLERLRWIDCAKPAKVTVKVAGVDRHVCREHRDDVRRIEAAGLSHVLRWSVRPARPGRRPKQTPGQLQLLDMPPIRRVRGWSL